MVLLQISPDASPGMPFGMLAATNKDLMENPMALFHLSRAVRLRLERLERLALDIKVDDYEYCADKTPQELVDTFCCDPVRVFVKNEPHRKRKIIENRQRLISSVSIVDQIIERLLFNEQNKAEIARWDSIPSKPGMGFSDDCAKKVASLAPPGVKAAEADLSAFDWSVQGWQLHMDGEVRIALKTDCTPLYANLVRARVYCLSNSVFTSSRGKMYSQVTPGIQLSGSFNTSSSNSRIRVLMAYLCGATWAFAMGDDCVESYDPDAVERYQKMGHILKFYKECGDTFEFCSQLFDRRTLEHRPVTADKMLTNLLNQRPSSVYEEAMFRTQFFMELGYHPDRMRIAELLEAVEWPDRQNVAKEEE